MLGAMQRVTPTDRDRAVRKLSAVTGGITVASMALTGGVMILAKNETDAKKATKARQASARLSLAGQEALVSGAGSRGGHTDAGPTVHVYTAATPDIAPKPVPTSTSAAPTHTTHKPAAVHAEPKAKAKALRVASPGPTSKSVASKVTTSKATTRTAAKLPTPTATKTSKPKPTDTPEPDPPSDKPDPVQSSGS
jgi:hypothetical protein